MIGENILIINHAEMKVIVKEGLKSRGIIVHEITNIEQKTEVPFGFQLDIKGEENV